MCLLAATGDPSSDAGVYTPDLFGGHFHPEMTDQTSINEEMTDRSISEVLSSLKSQKKRHPIAKKRSSSLTPDKSLLSPQRRRRRRRGHRLLQLTCECLFMSNPVYKFIYAVQFLSRLCVHCYVNLVHLLDYFLE